MHRCANFASIDAFSAKLSGVQVNLRPKLRTTALLLAALAFTGQAFAAEAKRESPDIDAIAFHQAALAKPVQLSSAKQTAEWLKSGAAVLIDLNAADRFAISHLEGAINLPGTELTDAALMALVPDKATRLVLYCSDTLYPTRRIALTTIGAPAFIQLGYENTTLLEPFYQSSDCAAANKLSKTPGVCGDLLRVFRADSLD